MLSISVGTLQLLLAGTNTGYTVQLPIQGLDGSDHRINTYNKPGEDGIVLSSLLRGGRTVTLKGVLSASTASAYEDLRRALGAVCAPQGDSLGNPVPVTVSFTTLASRSYFVQGYAQKPLFDYTYATYGEFQLTFICPDPLIYSSGLVTSSLISRPTGGGFILPFLLPVTSVPTTGGAGSVTNTGNEASLPVLTLTGQLTNPYILNAATGQTFQLNYTIAGGDVVVIDMAEKTVMLNGNTPLLSAKAAGSSWWPVAQGLNPILLNTGVAGDTGTLLARFYPAWSAV